MWVGHNYVSNNLFKGAGVIMTGRCLLCEDIK